MSQKGNTNRIYSRNKANTKKMKHMGDAPQNAKEMLISAQAHLRMAIELINNYSKPSDNSKDEYNHLEVEPMGRVASRLHV